MQEFVESHWQDLIALFVLLLGVSLVVFIPDGRVTIGGELVGAGLLGLHLRNGNETKPKKKRRKAEASAKLRKPKR